tara:strand:- start:7399 stop:8280 length:882 start_codon:yes stop_codon:yes gene_type:complete
MRDKIIFCICTKNRKKKLVETLSSISNLSNLLDFKIETLIISSDDKNYNEILKKFKKELNIRFYQEKLVGISDSRNKVLEILRNKKFSYASFFDDDCYVDKKWLKSMIELIREKKIDIVSGPQISVSNNIYMKVLERHETHKLQIRWASTNNIIFRKKAIENSFIFEKELNQIGGEDQLFFLQLNKIGKRIIWNKKALVYELRDKKRENFNWFFKRNLRYGASSNIIYKKLYGFAVGNFFIFFKILKDFTYSFIHLIKAISLNKKDFFKSIMYMTRVIGCLMGILRIQIKEYN